MIQPAAKQHVLLVEDDDRLASCGVYEVADGSQLGDVFLQYEARFGRG